MRPYISVVIPCYNASKYLTNCIEHLIQQTIGIQHLELIFVDDASTDDGATMEILMQYEKRYPDNIMVIPLEENLHQGGARNVGIYHASGKYLALCDADDWFGKDALRVLYETAEAQDCDIVEFLYHEVYSDQDETGAAVGDGSIRTWEIDSAEERKRYLISDDSTLGCWNKLYRMSMIQENQISFVSHVFWEEPSFTQMVRFYVRKHVFLQQPLYYYYRHAGSTMLDSYEGKKLHQSRTYAYLWEQIQNRGLYEQFPQEIDFLMWRGYFHSSLVFAAYAGVFFTNDEFVRLQQTIQQIVPEIQKNSYFIRDFAEVPLLGEFTYCDGAHMDMNKVHGFYREICKLMYGLQEEN